MTETHLALFKGKQIRKTIHDNEWWFVFTDAGEAQEKLQIETGKRVVTTENYLMAPEIKKRLGKKISKKRIGNK